MSDVADIPLEEEQQTREFSAQGPVPGSLEARIAERREKLERITSEVFDVPGYEGIFQVELRLLTGKVLHQITRALDRVHDDYQKNLRTAAEAVISATVCFYNVVNEEHSEKVETDWLTLARRVDPTLADGVPPRIGLIRLLGENGTVILAGEWNEWMRTRGTKLEKELRADF